MFFTLPPDKKCDLVLALQSFVNSFHQRLVDWQRIAGWASCDLNLLPLGRFSLQSSWEKISGKSIRNALVPVSREVKDDLLWLALAFEDSSGRLFITSSFWSCGEADAILYADACSTGLGVWFPAEKLGLFLQLPLPARNIFWAECVAIVVAIKKGIESKAHQIFIYTDSYLCFNLFSSHNPNSILRPVFRHIIKRMFEASVDVKVFHISGDSNTIADALGQGLFEKVSCFDPSTTFKEIVFDPCLLQGGKHQNLIEFNQNII